MKLFVVLIILGAALFGAKTEAQATSIAWGDPVLGHSWDQRWQTMLGQDFDSLIVTITDPLGAAFQSEGLINLSVGGWTITSDLPQQVEAAGPLTSTLEYTTHFMGNPTDYSPGNALMLDLSFYMGGAMGGAFLEVHTRMWDGIVWSDPNAPVAPLGPPVLVPDGGMTLVLLGVSALGIAWFRKKMI